MNVELNKKKNQSKPTLVANKEIIKKIDKRARI